jgi:hypothetical protein
LESSFEAINDKDVFWCKSFIDNIPFFQWFEVCVELQHAKEFSFAKMTLVRLLDIEKSDLIRRTNVISLLRETEGHLDAAGEVKCRTIGGIIVRDGWRHDLGQIKPAQVGIFASWTSQASRKPRDAPLALGYRPLHRAP